MFPFGQVVQGGELVRGQTHGHNLHRLGPASRTTTPATLEFLNVVSGFGLVRPVRDLLLAHHANTYDVNLPEPLPMARSSGTSVRQRITRRGSAAARLGRQSFWTRAIARLPVNAFDIAVAPSRLTSRTTTDGVVCTYRCADSKSRSATARRALITCIRLSPGSNNWNFAPFGQPRRHSFRAKGGGTRPKEHGANPAAEHAVENNADYGRGSNHQRKGPPVIACSPGPRPVTGRVPGLS